MQWLISLLGTPILNTLLEAYKAKLQAVNTQDQLAVTLAMKAIEAEIAARAEATKVITIENGRWWTAMPRALVQWSFSLFVVKVVLWDTMLSLGSTPPLHGDVASWAGMVMAMWFGGRTIEKVAQIFKR